MIGVPARCATHQSGSRSPANTSGSAKDRFRYLKDTTMKKSMRIVAMLIAAASVTAAIGNAPLTRADQIPVPNPNVAPDPASWSYRQGYVIETQTMSRNTFGFRSSVHDFVASIGGPSNLCVEATQIAFVDVQGNSNAIDIDQFYQGCMAATRTMLQTYR